VLAPMDGSTFSPGQTVQLIGQGYCYEEARPEREALYWTSSIDGELGRGPRVEVASLSPGEHHITLVAGVEPHQGNETVTIWYGEKDLSAARRE
jgi:chitinase